MNATWTDRVVLTTFHSTVFIIGLPGNTLVIIAFCLSKDFRSKPSNSCLLLLTIGDLLTTMLAPPYYATGLVTESFDKSRPILYLNICKVTIFSLSATGIVRIFAFTVMSVERFIAIAYPYFYAKHCSRRKIVMVAILIWVHAILSTLPAVLVSGWIEYSATNEALCQFTTNSDSIVYTAPLGILNFAVPTVTVIVMNIRVFWTARRQLRRIIDVKKSVCKRCGDEATAAQLCTETRRKSFANVKLFNKRKLNKVSILQPNASEVTSPQDNTRVESLLNIPDPFVVRSPRSQSSRVKKKLSRNGSLNGGMKLENISEIMSDLSPERRHQRHDDENVKKGISTTKIVTVVLHDSQLSSNIVRKTGRDPDFKNHTANRPRSYSEPIHTEDTSSRSGAQLVKFNGSVFENEPDPAMIISEVRNPIENGENSNSSVSHMRRRRFLSSKSLPSEKCKHTVSRRNAREIKILLSTLFLAFAFTLTWAPYVLTRLIITVWADTNSLRLQMFASASTVINCGLNPVIILLTRKEVRKILTRKLLRRQNSES
eukprot:Seg1079.9 transcript_id=Seg1079.9/GoldUCD/mRNA.D3Y31 product="alpha-1A adrenergic receptor" protein_id=Seg1079.9/GoldUCD/D3Y31